MVDKILKLAKEDYNAAVAKYTKRTVDKILADEKAKKGFLEEVKEVVVALDEQPQTEPGRFARKENETTREYMNRVFGLLL